MIQTLVSGFLRLTSRSAISKQVMSTGLHQVDTPTVKATFALGCFWGPDSLFGSTPGVIRTRVGFTGGSQGEPTYKRLFDHTEAIEIDFDPETISYQRLLELFWANHDPTARCTRQYTSIIFYHDAEQKKLAEKSLDQVKAKAKAPVVTTVVPASTFYDAEDYHQKYRLQQYPDLMAALGLRRDTKQLTGSHVAARLNGYVVGQGGVAQLDEEAHKLGLPEPVKDQVRKLVTKFQGHGLFC